MKNPFYRILSYLCIVIFIGYWIGLFICAMPSNYAKNIISNRAPRFKSIFGATWKLFTPPDSSNNRLYIIVRSMTKPDLSDTIEVLANISLQKQRNAPFNQPENVIDHLVNNNVIAVLSKVWYNKKMPAEDATGTTDSLYIANAIAAATFYNAYNAGLASLENYSKLVLKNNNIDLAGKETKIVIKKISIRPFKQMNDSHFLQKETLIFETPYKPCI
jgi:hypothetical protein